METHLEEGYPSFAPNKYMRKIRTRQGMQDYLDVKYRVMWVRSAYPDAQIITQKIAGGVPDGFVEFMCTITLPTGGMATGYGTETKEDFPDYPEKAESKSVGRACALLGFGTDAAADLDSGEPIDGLAASKDERAERRYESQSRPTTPPKEGGAMQDDAAHPPRATPPVERNPAPSPVSVDEAKAKKNAERMETLIALGNRKGVMIMHDMNAPGIANAIKEFGGPEVHQVEGRGWNFKDFTAALESLPDLDIAMTAT